MSRLPGVYVVSDSIGETAEMVVRAAASQFNSGEITVRRISKIADVQSLEAIVNEAEQSNFIIVYTLVQEEMAEALKRLAGLANVVCVDLLSPIINVFKEYSDIEPRREPGLLHKTDELYFQRVEAIEFAVRYDDGKDPRGILLADIVLVGISRTSKTPLSMYLANKRLKVANVPLVPEVKLPEELFLISPSRIIGLMIHMEQLNHIRTERLRTMGVIGQASYADPSRILEEIDYAKKLMGRLGCTIIDVTNKAIEETASRIMEIYNRRFSDASRRVSDAKL